ncbi:MAG: hypothetical protein AMXMBFR34_45860 [Myxococcaceae bacterium]
MNLTVSGDDEGSPAFWDALIVRAACEGGCTRLASQDLQHQRHFTFLVLDAEATWFAVVFAGESELPAQARAKRPAAGRLEGSTQELHCAVAFTGAAATLPARPRAGRACPRR